MKRNKSELIGLQLALTSYTCRRLWQHSTCDDRAYPFMSVGNLTDKLKHVGHLVAQFL
jgi:hypothetical protein